VCVNEDLGHGEGVGAHATLVTDTRRRVVSLAENAGRIPGVDRVSECIRKPNEQIMEVVTGISPMVQKFQ